jgi:hypothetical protein
MSIIKRIMVTKSVFGLPFSQHIFPYERIVDVKEKTVYIDGSLSKPVDKNHFF